MAMFMGIPISRARCSAAARAMRAPVRVSVGVVFVDIVACVCGGFFNLFVCLWSEGIGCIVVVEFRRWGVGVARYGDDGDVGASVGYSRE